MFGLFRRKDTPQPTPAPAPVPFPDKLAAWVDNLDWYARSVSNALSAEAYSELRRISDIFNQTIIFLRQYAIRAEEEYIAEATLTDYIPSALNIFMQLPTAEQTPGGVADKQLITQFQTIHTSVYQLNQQMHENVRRDLTEQTLFVQERFRSQV